MRVVQVARAAVRPPWVDVLAAAVCLTVGTLVYVADHAGGGVTGEGPDTVPLWVRIALLAVACGGQTLRRRAPVAALLLVVGAFTVDAVIGLRLPILVIVLADVMYAATAFGAAWLSRLLVRVVVALTAALVVLAWILADSWRSALWASAQIVVVLPTPVWWGAGIRYHRDVAAGERRRAEGLARLAELDRRAAVAAERQRMARDLHDVVAGHLSAIALQSEAVLSAGADREQVMRAVRENSVQALAEMRTMIELLRDDADDTGGDGGDGGLGGAGGAADDARAPRLAGMDRLVGSARAAGLRVSVEGAPPDGLPPAVDAAAYRILQEALTNAAAHAPRQEVSVRLATEGEWLVVEVSNPSDRTGFRAAGARAGAGAGAGIGAAIGAGIGAGNGTRIGTGSGVPSMRTRAEEAGGTLTAGPVAGRWRVRAELPL